MGQILILLDRRGQKYAAPVDGPMARVPDLGTFESANLLKHVGRRIDLGKRSLLVLEPSRRDLHETMQHGPQTLVPKDLAAILYEADIVPGALVVEAGAGSGGLTVALARAVGAAGRVVSYDMSEDALRVARANVASAGFESAEFRLGDIRKGVPDRDVNAVVLDLVDPWAAVGAAWEALRPCGHLATFSPNMEQMKETVASMSTRPFVDVRTIEIIEREMEVRDVGVRPSFAPLGHTGYLTFARKVLEPFP